MNNLQLVNDVTLFQIGRTYSIDGILYRYLYCTDSINHPQWVFSPLLGQKRRSSIQLNRDKVLLRVYEVPALYRQHQAEATPDAIQQSLF